MHTPRGKVLGGSSSINGLVYIRGNPQDFERWQRRGRARLELCATCCRISPRRAARRGRRSYRGDEGKLQTRYGSLENPLHAAWLAAAREAGYPRPTTSTAFSRKASAAWT
jgi:choline dehydrogenase